MGDVISDLGEYILAKLDQIILQQSLTKEEHDEMLDLLGNLRDQAVNDTSMHPDEKQMIENIYTESISILNEISLAQAPHETSVEPREADETDQAAAVEPEPEPKPKPESKSESELGTGQAVNAVGVDAETAEPVIPEMASPTLSLLEDLEKAFIAKMNFALEDGILTAEEFDDIKTTLAQIQTTVDSIDSLTPDERSIVERMCSDGLSMLQKAIFSSPPIGAGTEGSEAGTKTERPKEIIDSIPELKEIEERIRKEIDGVTKMESLTDDQREDIQGLIDNMIKLIYADNVVTPEESEIMGRVFEKTIMFYNETLKKLKRIAK